MINTYDYEALMWLIEDLKKRAGGYSDQVDGLIRRIEERLRLMEEDKKNLRMKNV